MASQDFLQDYVEEVREHLIDMEKSLLVLEQEGVDREQIAQVFRAAHSIKGASACMGFEGLTGLTHELENLIAAVQSSERSVPPAGISLLLDCVDLISKAVDHVKQNGSEPVIDSSLLESLHEAFLDDGFSAEESESEAAVAPPEEPAKPGVDSFLSESCEAAQEEHSPIEEEDEELLAIFVNLFQENMSLLFDLLNSSASSFIGGDDRKNLAALVETLIASARYMDYQPILTRLEQWSNSLTSGEGASRREALESLEAHAAVFRRLVPQLAIPQPVET
ncbi:MAG: Hpt domain-containing protein, partial [Syntrophobacteraceae bacterium]